MSNTTIKQKFFRAVDPQIENPKQGGTYLTLMGYMYFHPDYGWRYSEWEVLDSLEQMKTHGSYTLSPLEPERHSRLIWLEEFSALDLERDKRIQELDAENKRLNDFIDSMQKAGQEYKDEDLDKIAGLRKENEELRQAKILGDRKLAELEEAKNQLQQWSDKMGYSKNGNLAKIIEKLNTKQP
jgi:hypothetical protein